MSTAPNLFAGSGGLPAATVVGTLSDGANGLLGVSDANYLEASTPTLVSGGYLHYLARIRASVPTRDNSLLARKATGAGGLDVWVDESGGYLRVNAQPYGSGGVAGTARTRIMTGTPAGAEVWLLVTVREAADPGAGGIRIQTFNASTGAEIEDSTAYGGSKPSVGDFNQPVLLGRGTSGSVDASEVEGGGLQWAIVSHSAQISEAEIATFITTGSPSPGTGVWWYGSLPDPAPAPPTPTAAGGTLGRPATRGGAGVWLLDLDLGSETLHVGTRPARPRVRAAGLERVLYATGLDDLDFRAGSERVGVRVRYPDMAALRRKVGPLRGRRFRLWRWHPDLVLEDAYLALEGVVDAAAHADPDDVEGVSLTLARDVRALSLTYPTGDMVVDTATWPDCDDNIFGEPYPVVLGAPGSPLANGGAPVQATPGYLVHAVNHTILVAGHQVAATNVRAWNLTQGTNASSLAVSHVADGRGRVVAVVDGTGAFSGATSPARGDELVIGWDRFAWGGGLRGSEGTIVGVGDLLLWGVRTLSRGTWDLGRMAEYRAALNAFKLDTFWNEPTNWEDWVQSNVLSEFPIEEVQGPHGRYYRPIVYETDRTRIRAVIATPGSGSGRRVSRVSAVVESGGDIANFVEVLYGGQFGSAAYRRRLFVGPERGKIPLFSTGIDTRVAADFRARTSHGYYNTRMRTVQIPQTWDSGTAFAVGRYVVGRDALPSQIATYEGGDDLLDLAEHDTIEVWDTSAGADFRGDLGIVRRIEILPDGARIELEVPWDPLRRPTI